MRAGARGFTLVEVAVALAILALSLGVLYQTFGWGLRRTGLLQQQETALLTAQSMLAEIRARPRLQAGTTDGRTPQGMQWSAHIEPYDARSRNKSLRAWAVIVEVSWGAGPQRRVRLRSIETGTAS